MEDHIVTNTQTPTDAAALRAVLARQYGHFAEFLSRTPFDLLIDDLTLTRMSFGLMADPLA